jgi:methyl-accepting chemotaxis protein
MKTIQDNKTTRQNTHLERLSFSATHYIGSFTSLILHSIFFVGIFALQWLGFRFDQIMLILTTVVSLEAIYLSIFIQMTVNHQAHKLAEVSEEVEDISEDVEEISKDIDDIQEDVEEISEDVEDIGEEMEKDDKELALKHKNDQDKIVHIESILKELLSEIRELKDKHK